MSFMDPIRRAVSPTRSNARFTFPELFTFAAVPKMNRAVVAADAAVDFAFVIADH